MSPEESISHYDYELPEELIAREPAVPRDASRLLVIDRRAQTIEHKRFEELPQLLNAGDLLVMNDTRVLPARLRGLRTATGGKWEGLFLREESDRQWRIIGQTRGTLKVGERITLLPCAPGSVTGSPVEQLLELELVQRHAGGEWTVQPLTSQPVHEVLAHFGTIPLPHYMQREAATIDWERYQTTYARRPGAVAAPTAGLHFTPEVLQRCQARGIEQAWVTLHVGLGTFRPVSVDHLQDHRMHQEWCELPQATSQAISQTRARSGRVVAVGTTSVRTLESVARQGTLNSWQGETDLFIRPPYEFQVVDAMITNFHLPKSTLLVLVCTFADRDLMLRAYEEAIRERYRFYSYGDAMLIQ